MKIKRTPRSRDTLSGALSALRGVGSDPPPPPIYERTVITSAVLACVVLQRPGGIDISALTKALRLHKEDVERAVDELVQQQMLCRSQDTLSPAMPFDRRTSGGISGPSTQDHQAQTNSAALDRIAELLRAAGSVEAAGKRPVLSAIQTTLGEAGRPVDFSAGGP